MLDWQYLVSYEMLYRIIGFKLLFLFRLFQFNKKKISKLWFAQMQLLQKNKVEQQKKNCVSVWNACGEDSRKMIFLNKIVFVFVFQTCKQCQEFGRKKSVDDDG